MREGRKEPPSDNEIEHQIVRSQTVGGAQWECMAGAFFILTLETNLDKREEQEINL